MLKIRDALENSDATSGDMGKWMAPFDFRSSNRSIKLSNGVLIVIESVGAWGLQNWENRTCFP